MIRSGQRLERRPGPLGGAHRWEGATIEPGQRLSQQSPSAGGGWSWFLRGESPDEIGAAHDADDPAVAEHW
jgi:hypothetical protein